MLKLSDITFSLTRISAAPDPAGAAQVFAAEVRRAGGLFPAELLFGLSSDGSAVIDVQLHGLSASGASAAEAVAAWCVAARQAIKPRDHCEEIERARAAHAGAA